jgi:hypothetical protein
MISFAPTSSIDAESLHSSGPLSALRKPDAAAFLVVGDENDRSSWKFPVRDETGHLNYHLLQNLYFERDAMDEPIKDTLLKLWKIARDEIGR